jgi:hypothetical protein
MNGEARSLISYHMFSCSFFNFASSLLLYKSTKRLNLSEARTSPPIKAIERNVFNLRRHIERETVQNI